ncbi:MAG: hypothetical protein NTW19_03885 [Planctomycetota bacterium]|nr:hypothetical protein [Planctomycetota bacterium]
MRDTRTLSMFRAAALLGLMLAAMGCTPQGGGNLSIRSLTERDTTLRGGFTTGIYRYDDRNHFTVVLLDGPIENPTQAVTIRMLWAPMAGRTPIDGTATNATIHYVIFAGAEKAEAGVYSGAGYIYPTSDREAEKLEAGVWQANLRLTDRSPGFEDLLGQAAVKGGLTARRDDAAVEEALRKLNVLIRQKLGYPRLVEAGAAR